jgi:hypothetical protein
MENFNNNIEQNPVIEKAPVMESVTPVGEIVVPQGLPIVKEEIQKEVEPTVTQVKAINRPSLGYPINNNSLGSEIVREKMSGDMRNL